jgi:hypothetical protein
MSDLQQRTDVRRVIMTDIDIGFGRLVWIFLKFTVAAVPALLVLSILMPILYLLFAAVVVVPLGLGR